MGTSEDYRRVTWCLETKVQIERIGHEGVNREVDVHKLCFLKAELS